MRFRWLIIGLWIVAPVAATRTLPNLASVTNAANAGFLSADAPSQQAASLASPFQVPSGGATAVLVAVRVGGPLTAVDNTTIDQLEQRWAGVRVFLERAIERGELPAMPDVELLSMLPRTLM